MPGVVDAPYAARPPARSFGATTASRSRALLADMWLPSDNLIAEELLRELDVAANVRAGTLEGGTALERALAARHRRRPGHR